MNKKLVALLAVATMGISVVGATPQTQFTKVKLKLILALQALKLKQTVLKLLTNGTSMAISLTHCATKLLSIRLPWFEL